MLKLIESWLPRYFVGLGKSQQDGMFRHQPNIKFQGFGVMSEDDSLSSRVTVETAPESGIHLRCGHISEVVGWREVQEISATLAKHGRYSIFVVVVGLEDGRTIVVGETEPAWLDATEAIYRYLPGVPPFMVWGAKLLASPRVMELYPAPSA